MALSRLSDFARDKRNVLVCESKPAPPWAGSVVRMPSGYLFFFFKRRSHQRQELLPDLSYRLFLLFVFTSVDLAECVSSI